MVASAVPYALRRSPDARIAGVLLGGTCPHVHEHLVYLYNHFERRFETNRHTFFGLGLVRSMGRFIGSGACKSTTK